jgi:hypothetical protein
MRDIRHDIEYRMNGKKTRKSINVHRWYIVLQKRYYMYYI